MRLSRVFLTPCLMAALCVGSSSQTTESKDAHPVVAEGLPPRATPADYQAHTEVGKMTIAAEFMGHSVPKPDGPLTTEDYVDVEVGFFGPNGEKVQLSVDDFSLRINGKKSPLPRQPYGMVVSNLRDPSWSPPEEADSKPKSKSGLSTGGQGGGSDNSMPVVVHIPIALQRSMAQYVQKSSLREGDRSLPEAGLIFFQYRGNTNKIHSLELIYSGSSGKATLDLQP
jgi:hypothetical protein